MFDETSSLLLDTSFIIGLFYGDKSTINKVYDVLPALITVDHLYINNYIMSETLTVLSQRIGKTKAKAGLEFISGQRIDLIDVLRKTEDLAFDEFFKIERKDISFVDVMSVLQAKEKSIGGVLTLDKHFAYLGKKYDVKIFTP